MFCERECVLCVCVSVRPSVCLYQLERNLCDHQYDEKLLIYWFLNFLTDFLACLWFYLFIHKNILLKINIIRFVYFFHSKAQKHAINAIKFILTMWTFTCSYWPLVFDLINVDIKINEIFGLVIFYFELYMHMCIQHNI